MVYHSLCRARDLYLARSEPVPTDVLKGAVQSMLESELLVTQGQYIVIHDQETMRPIEKSWKGGSNHFASYPAKLVRFDSLTIWC
jgi:hypothetical protein